MKPRPDGLRTEASVSELYIRIIGLSPYSSAIYGGMVAVARVRSDARRPFGRHTRRHSEWTLVSSFWLRVHAGSEECFDEWIELAIEHAVGVTHLAIGAMVFDHAVGV